MTTVHEVEAILSRLPGWDQAEVRKLDGGSSGASYLLSAAAGRSVLKTTTGRRHFPLNSRSREAAIQASAHRAGIAPEVLYADDSVLLSAYVDGEPVTVDDLRSPEMLQRSGRLLRRLHAQPLSGREFRLADAARLYAHRAEARGIRYADIAERLEVVQKRAPPPSGICLSHNDLVVGNIINGQGLWLIDWEYACDNDPLFDLATVIAHHDLDDSCANVLLDAYFGTDSRHWMPRLKAMQQVYSALTWLWQASRT